MTINRTNILRTYKYLIIIIVIIITIIIMIIIIIITFFQILLLLSLSSSLLLYIHTSINIFPIGPPQCFVTQCQPHLQSNELLGPRLAQGLLQGLDDEAGGIGLHIHFGLAVPHQSRSSGWGSSNQYTI